MVADSFIDPNFGWLLDFPHCSDPEKCQKRVHRCEKLEMMVQRCLWTWFWWTLGKPLPLNKRFAVKLSEIPKISCYKFNSYLYLIENPWDFYRLCQVVSAVPPIFRSRILAEAYCAHFEDGARQAALQYLLRPQKLPKVGCAGLAEGFGGVDGF